MTEVILYNFTPKSKAQSDVQRAASPVRAPASVFLEPLRQHSLVPATALKSSSDEKPPVGASGFPPHSRS